MSDTEPYPPEHHVLRDLPFEMEDTGPDAARAHLTVVPEVCEDGRLSAGPVLVAVDVLAGLLVGRVIAPDWMATAQLALHLVDPPADGRLVVDASVRRAGRTTIVVAAALRSDGDAGGHTAGTAELTFVRLPRRDGNLDIADTPIRIGERISMALPDSGLRSAYADEIGLRVLDGTSGRAQLDASPFVRNSFGAVNGGVVASLAAGSAAALASDVLGTRARALDVVATYLAQARVGPLEARARLVRRDGPVALVAVDVDDAGIASDDGDGPRPALTAYVHCVADVER